jgi:hypothetical protein
MHLVFIVVEGDAVEKEYSSWIRGKYQASKRRFLELFSHSLDHIKVGLNHRLAVMMDSKLDILLGTLSCIIHESSNT